jgi:hypothetical protein
MLTAAGDHRPFDRTVVVVGDELLERDKLLA